MLKDLGTDLCNSDRTQVNNGHIIQWLSRGQSRGLSPLPSKDAPPFCSLKLLFYTEKMTQV